MIIGILGILIVAFFVSIAVFLFVPWLIGLTANAVSGSVTLCRLVDNHHHSVYRPQFRAE